MVSGSSCLTLLCSCLHPTHMPCFERCWGLRGCCFLDLYPCAFPRRSLSESDSSLLVLCTPPPLPAHTDSVPRHGSSNEVRLLAHLQMMRSCPQQSNPGFRSKLCYSFHLLALACLPLAAPKAETPLAISVSTAPPG